MKKLLGLATFVFFMITIFVGCGKTKASPLVGNWVLEDGQDYVGVVEDYKLTKDGSGITDNRNVISWKIENGRFSFVYESNSTAYELDYEISGDILTITFDDGRNFTYKKYVEKPNDYGNWRSKIEIDPITDNKKIYFRVYSTQGGYSMFIRKNGEELELYIDWKVELGSTRNVIFRIDDRTPETKSWDISTDGQCSFYPGNALSTIKSLLDANQVSVRCEPENKSPITAIFDVTDFRNIVEKYNEDLKWF